MTEKTVLACDRCDTEPAERFRIQHQQSVHEIDLCERHEKPIVDLLKYSRESRLPVPDGGGYERLTWDQIQAQARSAKPS